MKSELDKAIEMLKDEYEKALNLKWIRKPLAYALFKTWEYFDKKKVGGGECQSVSEAN